MSTTVSWPLLPTFLDANARTLFVRVTTVAIVVYPILLAWFTAPSKFLADNSYEAKLHGPRISARALPLELPKDEAELTRTLRANDPIRHEAQLRLHRRALAWDNVFIEIYVLQFAAVALMVVTSGRMRLLQILAIASIVTAGIFDWLENLSIQEILNCGGPPFGDLIARVTSVSTTKWIAIFVACSLLSPIVWRLPGTGHKFRIALCTALIVAAVVGFVGVLPSLHSLLPLSLLIYGIVPVLILWRFVISPAVDAIDTRLQATAALLATNEIQAMQEQGGVARFNVELRSTAPKWSLENLESQPEVPQGPYSTRTGPSI
jgi:ABC-type multidrug transport system fused ATPase/permease subunit